MNITVYYRDKTLRTDDRGDKQFYLDHGQAWEKVAVIKDSSNYDVVLERLKKQYSVVDVYENCVRKKRWGWRYFTDQEKANMVAAVKAANTGKVMSNETRAKMAAAKRGKRGNATGSRKDRVARALVSLARMGKDPIQGRKWCHHPLSGEEKRLFEDQLPVGWKWGRTPEIRDWLKRR